MYCHILYSATGQPPTTSNTTQLFLTPHTHFKHHLKNLYWQLQYDYLLLSHQCPGFYMYFFFVIHILEQQVNLIHICTNITGMSWTTLMIVLVPLLWCILTEKVCRLSDPDWCKHWMVVWTLWYNVTCFMVCSKCLLTSLVHSKCCVVNIMDCSLSVVNYYCIFTFFMVNFICWSCSRLLPAHWHWGAIFTWINKTASDLHYQAAKEKL